jgi:hypothetical protein
MGGTTSKPPAQPAFVPDINRATFSGDYVQSQLDKASQVAAQLTNQSKTLGSKVSILSTGLWALGILIILTALAFGIYYLIYWYGNFGSKEIDPLNWFDKTNNNTNTGPNNLLIHSATHGSQDITTAVGSYVKQDTLTIPSPISKTLSGSPSDVLTVTYEFSSDPNRTYVATFTDDTKQVVISPSNNPGTATNSPNNPSKSTQSTQATRPSMFSGWFSGTGGTGNLLPTGLDATTSAIVKAKDAPLSSQGQGAYGMQWWMFIRDWNYGYGKDKEVVVRTDPTNTAIANPRISLHPTDNTLKISVSIFPSSSDNSTKAQPAPAGHSGSTDDVYICEVPNLPLQDWFSVSVTVFERNLDVYIDGKLVKSCFLPGVPKPAAGDITLAGNGGFSGNMCNFYHYPRMLTPGDALTFNGGGTSCKSYTDNSAVAKATGYSVKFGVYDPVGKKVQEYSF